MINASLVQRASRLARPGMFMAALASIAIIAAASQLRRVGEQLEETLDEIESAQREAEALETQRASMMLEIHSIAEHRNELMGQLRQSLADEIMSGRFDDAVRVRASVMNSELVSDDVVAARLQDHKRRSPMTAPTPSAEESTDVNVQ